MVDYLRRFLVVVLVLLQVAAPLVHAHVDNLGATTGLHLHEFETFQVNSTAFYSSFSDKIGWTESAIVDMGSAINSQSVEDLDQVFAIIQPEGLLWSAQSIHKAINFSPQNSCLILVPSSLSQHLSRAPPAWFSTGFPG